MWNKWPEEVMEAGTMTKFSRHLNRFLDRNNSQEYGLNVVK